jgi:NTF2 fold immunity protein of polymorphic toxin system component
MVSFPMPKLQSRSRWQYGGGFTVLVSLSRKSLFVRILKNGVWTVEGTLPQNFVGGVAHAEIAKADGRIIRVFHTE